MYVAPRRRPWKKRLVKSLQCRCRCSYLSNQGIQEPLRSCYASKYISILGRKNTLQSLTLAGSPVMYPRVYMIRLKIQSPEAAAVAIGYLSPAMTVLNECHESNLTALSKYFILTLSRLLAYVQVYFGAPLENASKSVLCSKGRKGGPHVGHS